MHWTDPSGLTLAPPPRCHPLQEQPDWLQQLVHGAQHRPPTPLSEAGDVADVSSLMRSPLSSALLPLAAAAGGGQPLLPHLLAGADWRRLAACMHAEEAATGGGAPWLLLPLLLAPATAGLRGADDAGSRLVHAAALLSRAAVLAGTHQALVCAAGAAGPLLLLSVCQGAKHHPGQAARAQQAQQAAAAVEQQAAVEAQQQQEQEQVVIPEGFPMELLADTVEGQQLLLLQQQAQERQQLRASAAAVAQEAQPEGQHAASAAAAAAVQQEAAAVADGAGPELPLVEVIACWSLTCDQHVALLQQALLPLAASHASLALAAHLQSEHCPAELVAAAASQQPGGSAGSLPEWHAPRLAELIEASGGAAAASAATTDAPEAADAGGHDATEAAAAGLAAVLMPLVRQPVTLLTSEALPFSTGELPLDTEAAVYVSVAPDSTGARRAPQRPLRALGATLSALLPGSEARRRAAERAEAAVGAPDAHIIKAQLSRAVQVGAGPAC